jgi:hypothetical protein
MNPSSQGQGFFGVKVSKPGVDVNQANPNDLVYQSDYTSTIYYDKNNSRFIEGLLPDSTYGVWVSQPGQEANDPNAATDNHLIFNSNQDIFKIISKGTAIIPSFAIGTGHPGFALITIPHGQSFTPIVNIYASAALLKFSDSSFITSSYIPLPIYVGATTLQSYWFPSTTPGTNYSAAILFGVDAANIYIEASVQGSTVDTMAPIPITYFLLQETAT